MGPYILDSDRADGRLGLLAAALDPFTAGRISHLRDLEGTTCWEVGAGAGTIAGWLAERVGPFGRVLATDLDVSAVPDMVRLTRQVHDVAGEWPPKTSHRFTSAWDLIHARLVLAHLPERVLVLDRLAQALSPGGVLLLEEWVTDPPPTALDAADRADADLFNRFQAAQSTVFGLGGVRRTWGRELHAVMRRRLDDVHTIVRADSWDAGSPGALQHALTMEQLRPQLCMQGMTGAELDRINELLCDPGSGLVVLAPLLYSVSGRRPG